MAEEDLRLRPAPAMAGHTSFEVPTVSLPFELGEHRRVAVKIVDDRDIESLKVLEVEA